MNRNLFIKEIKGNIKSLLLWMLVITMLVTITMSVYPSFIENQSKITGMLNLLPKGILQFKGISNFNDLLSAQGFYAVNNVIYMLVLGSIFAIVLSSGILLREEYNKTAEYLLTRPITRSEVFLSKSLVIFLNIVLLNIVTTLAGFICIEIFSKGAFNFESFMILSFYTFLLNLLFGTAGLFMSTVVKRPKPITTFSIALVLILYFIYTLSKITGNIAWLGYLSPFKFVNLEVTNPAYKLEFVNLVYFMSVTIFLFLLSYRMYLRKDIYT